MTDEVSPYNYFQERYRSPDPWRLLVVVMMLNQTSGKQVELVHEKFFALYPDVRAAAFSARLDEDKAVMSQILRPLGFYNRRARAIVKMSNDYLARDGRFSKPSELHGLGKYADDSWSIFIDRVIPEGVTDKELRKYIEWYRSRST